MWIRKSHRTLDEIDRIGPEILTALGDRSERVYKGHAQPVDSV